MKRFVFIAALSLAAVGYAEEKWDPTPGDLLRDQVDDTDIFAIPLDQSNVEDNYDIKEMHEDQREYFKKHPEAYKKWIESRPNQNR